MSTGTPKRDHHETFESIRRDNVPASTARQVGVETPLDDVVFQDHGYWGLYGGRTMYDIHAAKELKKSQKILDHMGSTELAANLFRATQTEEKLKRDAVATKARANDTHFEVGQKVRATIGELGGTMPEHLPTPQWHRPSRPRRSDVPGMIPAVPRRHPG